MTHVVAFLVQNGYRGRNDDGSETAASWKALQNTDWNQALNTLFRVRLQIEETAGASTNGTAYTLEYSLNAGAWTPVSSTGLVRFGTSAFVTDGTATTNQLSGDPQFVPGEYDQDGAVAGVSHVGNDGTEMEYGVILDASLADQDQIQFRAVAGGAALDSYTAIPTVTVADGPVAATALTAHVHAVGHDGFSFPRTQIAAATFAEFLYVGDRETLPAGLVVKPDGARIYVIGKGLDDIIQYDMSPAFSVSTGVETGVLAAIEGDGLAASPDGARFFPVGTTRDEVTQYDLTVPWDVGGGNSRTDRFVTTGESFPLGVAFRYDGHRMYVIGSGSDAIQTYALTTAWDTRTVLNDAPVHSFSVGGQSSNPRDLVFTSNGKQLFVIDGSSQRVYQYFMEVAFDLSTAEYEDTFLDASVNGGNNGIALADNDTKLYLTSTFGANVDCIVQYDLPARASTPLTAVTAGVDASASDMIVATDYRRFVLAFRHGRFKSYAFNEGVWQLIQDAVIDFTEVGLRPADLAPTVLSDTELEGPMAFDLGEQFLFFGVHSTNGYSICSVERDGFKNPLFRGFAPGPLQQIEFSPDNPARMITAHAGRASFVGSTFPGGLQLWKTSQAPMELLDSLPAPTPEGYISCVWMSPTRIVAHAMEGVSQIIAVENDTLTVVAENGVDGNGDRIFVGRESSKLSDTKYVTIDRGEPLDAYVGHISRLVDDGRGEMAFGSLQTHEVDTETNQITYKHQHRSAVSAGQVNDMALTADGRYLAAATGYFTNAEYSVSVLLFERKFGRLILRDYKWVDDDRFRRGFGVAWNDAGSILLASADNASGLERVGLFSHNEGQLTELGSSDLGGGRSGFLDVYVTPDGTRGLVYEQNTGMHLLDLTPDGGGLYPLTILATELNISNYHALDPSGRYLAARTKETSTTVSVYDLQGDTFTLVDSATINPREIVWNPAGTRFYTGGSIVDFNGNAMTVRTQSSGEFPDQLRLLPEETHLVASGNMNTHHALATVDLGSNTVTEVDGVFTRDFPDSLGLESRPASSRRQATFQIWDITGDAFVQTVASAPFYPGGTDFSAWNDIVASTHAVGRISNNNTQIDLLTGPKPSYNRLAADTDFAVAIRALDTDSPSLNLFSLGATTATLVDQVQQTPVDDFTYQTGSEKERVHGLVRLSNTTAPDPVDDPEPPPEPPPTEGDPEIVPIAPLGAPLKVADLSVIGALLGDGEGAPPKVTALNSPTTIQRSIDTDVAFLMMAPKDYIVDAIVKLGALATLELGAAYTVQADQPGLRSGRTLALKSYRAKSALPDSSITLHFVG